MQFNDKSEELGDLGLKVLNEMWPFQKKDQAEIDKNATELKDRASLLDRISKDWGVAKSALDNIVKDIQFVRDVEYAKAVEDLVANLSRMVDEAIVVKQ